MSKYPRIDDELAATDAEGVLLSRTGGETYVDRLVQRYARDLLDARAIIEAKDKELAISYGRQSVLRGELAALREKFNRCCDESFDNGYKQAKDGE